MDETFTTKNDVLIGRDGELFLASGGHRSLEYATGKLPINQSTVDVFQANIQSRLDYASERGIPFLHVIFPDKQSIVTSSYVTEHPVRLGQEYIRQCVKHAPIFYPLDLLRDAGCPVFLKTDTHLTDIGTIIVVSQVFERLTGLSSDPHIQKLLSLPTITRDHQGDLGTKLEPPRHHNETFVQTSWPKAHYHNDIQGGNNGAVSIYVTPRAVTDKRLLWFGDSFGREAVRFLSFYFREILFLRTPFFHPELVDLVKPDLIVSENVERYLASCQHDNLRPNFFMFPFLSDRTVHCNRQFAEAFSGMMSFPRKPYQDFLETAHRSLSVRSDVVDRLVGVSPVTNVPLKSSIELPEVSLKKAADYGVVPNIHPEDFIYQFVKRKWKENTAGAVENYYNLGNYCTGLLSSLILEVQSVKKFTERAGGEWQPRRILDFASGYGCSSRHMKHVFVNSEVTTCDIHPEAIEFNKNIIGLESILSSPVPERLSLPPQDVIVAMSFFSHMPEATFSRWLHALANGLANGGVLIFTANGFVTERRATTGVTAGSNGFGFQPRSEQLDLDGGEYGTTISYPKWVFPLIEQMPGMRLAKFQEGHWWAIQDTYVCIKTGD